MRTSIAAAAWAAAFAAGSASQPLAQPVGLDKLVNAYPAFLVRYDGNDLVWRDGTKLAVSDGRPNKTFAQRLLSASIADQLSLPYRKGPLAEPPGPGEDSRSVPQHRFLRQDVR